MHGARGNLHMFILFKLLNFFVHFMLFNVEMFSLLHRQSYISLNNTIENVLLMQW